MGFFIKSCIFACMEQVSGFIFSSEYEFCGTVDRNTSRCRLVALNVLIRTKRDGRWWILEGRSFLAPAVRQQRCIRACKAERIRHYEARPASRSCSRWMGIEEVDGYGKCLVMEWIDGRLLEKKWLRQPHSKRERVLPIDHQLRRLRLFVKEMKVERHPK